MSNPEREVTDIAEILAILSKHEVCRIGFNDNLCPYVVPVNFGYEYQNGRWIFYFHGARTGKKMRLLRKNPAVCIEMDGDHALLRADAPCDYSYAYTSVFATGLASILQTRDEMRYGLDVIMRQTNPGKTFNYREDMMKAVCVVRIECDALTCRRHLATQSE
ncbi:pyridoxamine 5'-phosphate oxidase family protein [Salmonella enterica subsp. enterica serovar Newport]|nr:pyridoxamine 5'-phosphate oxidase family protein [Salmonella enterica]EEE7783182.1 pyridoxamine 5'-phosphate oxidase family protein [Salmonella enterica subsp. enterica serovar Newport]EIL6863337.1 pyridoxamine 5'-phosphate oxidase family protein [Salmonella enterica]